MLDSSQLPDQLSEDGARFRLRYTGPMTVNLSQRGQEMLETALARGLGRTPEEIVERALETVTRQDSSISDRDQHRQAVAGMLAFREKYHLRLGPGVHVTDLIHEGHKY